MFNQAVAVDDLTPVVIGESELEFKNGSFVADTFSIYGKRKIDNCNFDVKHLIMDETSDLTFINCNIKCNSIQGNGNLRFENCNTTEIERISVRSMTNISSSSITNFSSIRNGKIEAGEGVFLENGAGIHARRNPQQFFKSSTQTQIESNIEIDATKLPGSSSTLGTF